MDAASIPAERVPFPNATGWFGVQNIWAATPVPARLNVLREARHLLAAGTSNLVDAFPATLARTRADSLAAEVLPLLAACRFLERQAPALLAPRRLGRGGLPFWLAGVNSVIERVPFGRVLVLAPANYPLFLPGVQTLQALAAGNAVVWKPGSGGRPVALVFADMLGQAGLPQGLLRVTEDTAEAGMAEVRSAPGKIFFTGSAAAFRKVAQAAAGRATPLVAELAGCDAVVVLPSADAARVADALCFGMRLNGSATCMAPRRLFLVGAGHEDLLETLQERFMDGNGIAVNDAARAVLLTLLAEAEARGARVVGDREATPMRPLLLLDGDAGMRIAQEDIFLPVLTTLRVADEAEFLRADAQCPFGLTVSIFGDEKTARALGEKVAAGTVLINDLIVPTADPRVPFGGRRGSGFGVTRGAEGLLEMTAVRTVLTRRGKDRRHYQPTTQAHEALFAAVALLTHGRTFRERRQGLGRMVRAAQTLRPGARQPNRTKEQP